MGLSRSATDRLGIWASVGCTVHCVIAPLLFLLVPTFAGVWAHPASHALIALLVLPLAGTVLLRGYRAHRRRWILTTTLLGALAIVVGCILPYAAPENHGATESAVAPSGAVSCTCCPQLERTEEGEFELELPPASIATILGSVLLVASHSGNLMCGRRHR